METNEPRKIEEVELTKERLVGWGKKFFELAEKFFGILHRRKKEQNPKMSIDEEFLQEMQSDEERRVLKDIYEEIDLYNEKMRELMTALKKDRKLTPAAWLKKQVEDTANELAVKLSDEGRELTKEEIEELENQIAANQDKQIEEEVNELAEDLNLSNEETNAKKGEE